MNLFKSYLIFILGGLFLIPSLSISQQWTTGGDLLPYQEHFEIHHYDINLEVKPDEKRISGFVDVHLKFNKITNTPDSVALELTHHFEISEVLVDGVVTNFRRFDDVIHVVAPAGENKVVRIYYDGQPHVAIRSPWDGGFNWSEDPNGNHWVGVSSQLNGGKLWFPSKDHPSSRADSVAIRLMVPNPYMAVSNGLLENVENHGDKTTWHWFTRYPIQNYNVTLNVGMFEEHQTSYTTEMGDEMSVIFYALDYAAPHADELLQMTVEKLEILRSYFGEYGFTEEKFGLVHTDYLGMEHQTINSYGNEFQFTEIDGRNYDWLLLHEMIHEWWGNLITVNDWAHFWIHEGITTWTDAMLLWEYFGPEAYHTKIREYIPRVSNRMPVIPGRNLTTAEVYNHDVYYKGAYFMHTLHFVLGRENLMEGLRTFVAENKYGYVETEDIITHLQTYSETELAPLFHLYLETTTLPEIIVEKITYRVYAISISNLDLTLEMEVLIDGQIEVMSLSSEPLTIELIEMPVVDPNNWFLKEKMH